MRSSTPSGHRPLRRQAGLGFALVIFVLLDSVSRAEETAAPTAVQAPVAESAPAPIPAEPSVIELKAQAYDADQASRQAAAAAAEADAAAAAARAAVEAATGVAPAAAAAGAGAAAAVPAPAAAPSAASDAALHQATEAAESAAAAARAATAALQAEIVERKNRYSRSGVVLLGTVFWAPDIFDTEYAVGDSKGVSAALGYHFAKNFEVDVRFEAVSDFDLSGFGNRGSFKAWSTTLNGRFYLLTKQFQPYLGLGVGVMEGTTFLQDVATGASVQYEDIVAVFRVAGGFDFYVSETLALTADAAVVAPGGVLSDATYATLGGGIKLRF